MNSEQINTSSKPLVDEDGDSIMGHGYIDEENKEGDLDLEYEGWDLDGDDLTLTHKISTEGPKLTRSGSYTVLEG